MTVLKRVHKLTADGYFIPGDWKFINENISVPDGYTDVEPLTPEGVGMYRPRLVNGIAVETDELEEINPVPPVQEPTETEKLQAQVKASNDYMDFLEEVIVEMAQVVYQ